jgi:hypothetical protein
MRRWAVLTAFAAAIWAVPATAQVKPRALAISTDGGFARLIFAHPKEIEALPELVGGILSVPVPQAVALPKDLQRRLAAYLQAAERERGTLRLTLAAGVTANVMAAGTRLYVDLLPPGWSGLPPPLPKDAIDGLTRRVSRRATAPSRPVAEVVPPAVTAPASTPADPVVAEIAHETGGIAIVLPFTAPTNAALFRLGDAHWLALDTESAIDISALAADRRLRDAELVPLAEGRALRIPVEAGEFAALAARDTRLVLSFGTAPAASRALLLDRQTTREGLAGAFVPLANAGRALRLRDPGSGEEIVAVTAALPARGLPRARRFVDFRLLESAHGLALIAHADDLSIELAPDGVTITRPGGLRLTGDGTVASISGDAQIYGALSWHIDRAARFRQREAELVGALTAALPEERFTARLVLARFYLANGLGAEAKGVLDAADAAGHAPRDPASFALRGLALLYLARAGEAAEELARPELVDSLEAALLRAVALADAGRFAEARTAYLAGVQALSMLPATLQRMVRVAALRTAIELDRVGEARLLLHALESREPPGPIEPHLAVLAARLAARLGRTADADKLLAMAEHGADEIAAAEARRRRAQLAAPVSAAPANQPVREAAIP